MSLGIKFPLKVLVKQGWYPLIISKNGFKGSFESTFVNISGRQTS